MFTADATTFEIGQARLRLREGLRFTLHSDTRRPWYLIEDNLTGQFYRVGLPEYTLLSVLNGKKSLAAAVAETSSLLGGQAFDEQQAANLCRWVIESGLAETDASRANSRVEIKKQQQSQQKLVSRLNPISMKFPVFNPDKLVTGLNRGLGWLISLPTGMIWIGCVLAGFGLMLANWDLMITHRVQSFGAHDVAWMTIAWLMLKVLHETAHALVCKRFGGDVPQFGILVLLLIPLPFVDVTSAWRLASRWQRILTSAAGMIVELLVASISIFVWSAADPGPVRYHAENIILIATMGTILFNANPLMRFDGYFILADWLEIPNLYQHGRQYVKGLAKAVFLGTRFPVVAESTTRARIIMAYGWGSTIWFVVVTISLTVAASSLLEGFGLILALIGASLWIGWPIVKLIRLLVWPTGESIDRGRFALASATCLALILLAGWLVPGPTVFTAPFVIDHQSVTEIRSDVPGFVRQIMVEPGERVCAGQLLAVVDNLQLRLDHKTAGVNVRESEIRARSLRHLGNISGWRIELDSQTALNKRLDELTRLVDSLRISAPVDGVVLTHDLKSQLGTWLNPGSSLMEIGEPDSKLAMSLVRQADSQWLKNQQTITAELTIDGSWRSSFVGAIANVRPRAQDHVPHPAFAATYGGPLSVINREQVDQSGANSSADQLSGLFANDDSESHSMLKLTTPRVLVEITIDGDEARELFTGQTGTAWFRNRHQCLGAYLVTNACQWLRRNLTKSHGV